MANLPKLPPALAAKARAVSALATGSLFNTPPVQQPGSKIGWDPSQQNRNQASAQQPQTNNGANARMSATTYFTQAPITGALSPVVYEADRLWARVTLILETAGPVCVGFNTNLTPVTSGAGILLDTGVPLVLDIPKGNKLYIQATGVNRVKVIVQSVPWLEQITGLIQKLLAAMGVS